MAQQQYQRNMHARVLLLLVLLCVSECGLVATRQALRRQVDANYWIQSAAEHYKSANITVSSSCDEKLGLGFIEAWKVSVQQLCAASRSRGASVSCFSHPRRGSAGNDGGVYGGKACFLSQLVLNSSSFASGDTPQNGSASVVGCSLRSPLPWPDSQLTDGLLDAWFQHALVPAPNNSTRPACSSVVDEVPLFVNRLDKKVPGHFINAYHSFESFVNTFMTLAVAPQSEVLNKLEVVLVDNAPPGYWFTMWRRIAARGHTRSLRRRPFPDGTCFRRAILAATPGDGGHTLYNYQGIGEPSTCRSLVLHAVVSWAQYLMRDTRPGFHDLPRGGQFESGPVMHNEGVVVGRVLWLSRAQHEASLARQGNLTWWHEVRALGEQEQPLVRALHDAVDRWNRRGCLYTSSSSHTGCRQLPVSFEFQSVELSNRRWFPDQLHIYSRTNIMVGVHGAGLTNMIWMPLAASTVIEVQHNSGGNFHYHNIAHMLGIKYVGVLSANEPQQLAAALMDAMDDTAARMHAEQLTRRAGVA